MAALNTPVTTVVLAADVPISGFVDAPAKAAFDAIVAKIAELGHLVPEPTGLAFTLTLAASNAAEGALIQLAEAAERFARSNPGLRLRGVAHYGVVFRSESDGKSTYTGSAIRGAQNALKKAPADISLAGTPDFHHLIGGLAQPPVKLHVQRGGIDGSDLCIITLRDGASPPSVPTPTAAPARPASPSPAAPAVPEIDPALIQFLKQRLAAEVGPFAGPLVDKAKRTSTGPGALISALAQEVTNPAARVKFETEANAFLRSANRGR